MVIFNFLKKKMKQVNCYFKSLHINKKKINNCIKPNGITLCIRLNNDVYVPTLLQQLEWISMYVNEIIIHYNSLKNESFFINECRKIDNIFLKKYPSKLDFNEYTNSFVKESNYRWILMFDSDIIVLKKDFIKMIKKILNSKPNKIHYFSGINIFYKDQKLWFNNLKNLTFDVQPFVGNMDFFAIAPEYNNNIKIMNDNDNNLLIDKPLNKLFGYNFSYNFNSEGMGYIMHGPLFLHLSQINICDKYPNVMLDNFIFKKEIMKNMNIIFKNDTNFSKWILSMYKSHIDLLNKKKIKDIYILRDRLDPEFFHKNII